MLYKKFMVVDDSPIDQLILKVLLQRLDLVEHILSADNGLDAIAQMKFHEGALPELIFVDINMPGMNGFELIQKLRTMGYTQFSKVIIVSSSTLIEEKMRALAQEDVLAYIEKPPSATQLHALLCNSIRSN